MKSICIVSTQMQLINCVELVQSLKMDCNELLIIASSEKRKQQILTVVENLSYKKVFTEITVITPISKWAILNSIITKRKIDVFFSRRKSVNCLVLSNYKELLVRYGFYLVWKTNPSVKTYVVDDGLSLLEIVRRRNYELDNNAASIVIDSRHLKLLYPIKRLNRCIAKELVFFTNHNISDLRECDRVLVNDYHILKTTSLSALQVDSQSNIYIIGQPLPQQGILRKDVYNDFIYNFINNNRPSGRVYYVPHPVESIDDSLDDRVKSIISVVNFDLPFELYSLAFHASTIIVGYFSAALYNVHKIRPDLRVVSIYPGKDYHIFLESRELIDNVYSTLLSSGIELYYKAIV